jgi:acetyl/propionyl-CoA carboxylase alpha subunit
MRCLPLCGAMVEEREIMREIHRLLIANRGEIALRIARTCRRLGIEAVGVHSDADSDARHTRELARSLMIGSAAPEASYLRIEAVVEAAAAAGVDAVHPGYGFLSENADFAAAVERAGMVWIGPPPAAIRAMGDKGSARRLARAHGIATLVGYDGAPDDDDEALGAAAAKVGFPLMVKAVAGGGGRGMRLVERDDELCGALDAARREAQAAFGDGRLLLERYLADARHVEVQVLADSHGRVVQLFERDCSVQRRRQKVVEEAPSPAVDAHLRARLGEAAVRIAQLVEYRGAGTVEFLLDSAGDYYFLEMNTRLQVEHPITEQVSGLDLVELQIRIAEGQALDQESLPTSPEGHAIEARIYAEDPMREFCPVSGDIVAWDIPQMEGVRVDAGYGAGDRVSVHYDALLAKVIAWGTDRRQATRRLRQVLQQAWIAGITTNLPLLRQIASDEAWNEGRFDTGFFGRAGLPRSPPIDVEAAAISAVALDWLLSERIALDLTRGWRCWGTAPLEAQWQAPGLRLTTSTIDRGSGRLALAVQLQGDELRHHDVWPLAYRNHLLQLKVDGTRQTWRVALRRAVQGRQVRGLQANDLLYVHTGLNEAMLRLEPEVEHCETEAEASGTLVAPMPGTVAALHVQIGQELESGAPLVTLEAMKMQHTLVAPRSGSVGAILVEAGDTVEEGAVLVTLE